jgi:acylphosphatase
MAAMRTFFEGRVQGVGFRYSVKQVAMGYDVTGWIRNLHDGRVEMQTEGEPAEIDAFHEGIQESHLGSLIRSAQHQPVEGEGCRGFEIRPTI